MSSLAAGSFDISIRADKAPGEEQHQRPEQEVRRGSLGGARKVELRVADQEAPHADLRADIGELREDTEPVTRECARPLKPPAACRLASRPRPSPEISRWRPAPPR